jgi:DNA-binding NarL/FixJ family response regulator
MKVRVAVRDPLPAYRRGIMTILDEVEFPVRGPEEPDDLVAWASEGEKRVAIVTVDLPASSQGWGVIRDVKERAPRAVLIAVLVNVTLDSYMRALASGATSAFPRDAPPELIRRVFMEAIEERSLLPFDLISALVERAGISVGPGQLADEQIVWLRGLAKGVPIARMADSAGYSERAMYRLLNDLYKTMGVANRAEAIIRASQSGWL